MSISSDGDSREKPNTGEAIVKKDVEVQTEAALTKSSTTYARTPTQQATNTPVLEADDSLWLSTQLQKVGIEAVDDILGYLPLALLDYFVRFVGGVEKKAVSQRCRLKRLLERLLAGSAADIAFNQEQTVEGLPQPLIPYAALLAEVGLESYEAIKIYIKPSRKEIKYYINYVTEEDPDTFPTPAARLVFQIAIEAAYKAEGILEDADD
jgi:hypothetical protein